MAKDLRYSGRHMRVPKPVRSNQPHDSGGQAHRAEQYRSFTGILADGAAPAPRPPRPRPTRHRPTVCIALIPVLWLCFMIVRGLSHSRLRVVLLTCPCLMLRRQSKGDSVCRNTRSRLQRRGRHRPASTPWCASGGPDGQWLGEATFMQWTQDAVHATVRRRPRQWTTEAADDEWHGITTASFWSRWRYAAAGCGTRCCSVCSGRGARLTSGSGRCSPGSPSRPFCARDASGGPSSSTRWRSRRPSRRSSSARSSSTSSRRPRRAGQVREIQPRFSVVPAAR